MTNSLVTKNHYKLPEDYPFYEAFMRQQNNIKRRSQSNEGIAGKRKVTITVEEEWLPVPFSKLFQNKELLGDLSPESCKILIHIALNIGFNEHRIRIVRKEVGLSSRVFSRAMLELCFKRIIQKVEQKREWYWINLTILIVGSVEKADL